MNRAISMQLQLPITRYERTNLTKLFSIRILQAVLILQSLTRVSLLLEAQAILTFPKFLTFGSL
jgi:hypothetical protein